LETTDFAKFPVDFPTREFRAETGSPLTVSSATKPLDTAASFSVYGVARIVPILPRVRLIAERVLDQFPADGAEENNLFLQSSAEWG
jgi:hypothetical protein